MRNESPQKTLLVASLVCLVCSVLVSTAAVTLKGIQAENRRMQRLKNILEAGNLLEEGVDLKSVYRERIQAQIVVLESGEMLAEKDWNEFVNPEAFDIKRMVKHEDYSRAIPAEEDIAQIHRKPTVMVLYRVRNGGRTVKTIFPIYGKGLWSTMYGFIALDGELRTIQGFTFYEHGETPGLGGEIDNPRWKKLWVGKEAFDVDGNLRIRVIKGSADASAPESRYLIDGLSGSTLTTRGVNNLVRYWLGEDGYGPAIRRMRGEAPIEQE